MSRAGRTLTALHVSVSRIAAERQPLVWRGVIGEAFPKADAGRLCIAAEFIG
jgi:hypothetical protein